MNEWDDFLRIMIVIAIFLFVGSFFQKSDPSTAFIYPLFAIIFFIMLFFSFFIPLILFNLFNKRK